MDTTALRVLAIVLIANSHLEEFYPFRPLAADGLIGNSLFFLLSGLGLSLSPRIGEGRFVAWNRRRLGRIYPSLWITVVVGMIVIEGAWRHWSPLDAVRSLVWPTPYAFIAQIVAFYPAFYLVKAARNRRVELGVMLGLCAVRGGGRVSLRSPCSELGLLFPGDGLRRFDGRACRRHGPRSEACRRGPGRDDAGVRRRQAGDGHGPHPHARRRRCTLLTYPILWSLLEVCAAAPVQAFARRSRFAPALGLVAGLTLEIYLVHDFVRGDARVLLLPFPLNIAAFWAATLPLAWVLSAAADRARRLMKVKSRTGPQPVSARPITIGASPETVG